MITNLRQVLRHFPASGMCDILLKEFTVHPSNRERCASKTQCTGNTTQQQSCANSTVQALQETMIDNYLHSHPRTLNVNSEFQICHTCMCSGCAGMPKNSEEPAPSQGELSKSSSKDIGPGSKDHRFLLSAGNHPGSLCRTIRYL